MPYVTNEAGLERLRDACAKHGLELAIAGAWWRHGGALDKAWQEMGWTNINPKLTIGSFDLGGGCVGWFRKFVNQAGFDVWSLECVSPDGLEDWPAGRTCSPTQLRIGLNLAVNQHQSPRKEKPVDPNAPNNHLGLTPGRRVACVARNGRGLLGVVESVDDLGQAVTVRLSPDGPPEDAREYSRKWFGVVDNDEGFDKLWFADGGPREFKNYYALRGALRSPARVAENKAKRKETAAERAGIKKAKPPPVDDIRQSAPWRGMSVDAQARMETRAGAFVDDWVRTGQVAKDGRAAALQHALKWVLENETSKR